LLLVFVSQKVIHNVRDETVEFVVPLGKEIKDILTWQGMQNIIARRHRKEKLRKQQRAPHIN